MRTDIETENGHESECNNMSKANSRTDKKLSYALHNYIKEYLLSALRAFKDARLGQSEYQLDIEIMKKIQRMDLMAFDQFCHEASARMIKIYGVPRFCLKTLINCTSQLDLRAAESNLLEDFVRYGASQEMLRQLFGLRRVDVADIRERLGVNISSGRPAAPSDSETERVLEAWVNIPSSIDERLRLLVTHLETELPMTKIWNIVRANQNSFKLIIND